MSPEATRILEAALALPPMERRKLAFALLDSLTTRRRNESIHHRLDDLDRRLRVVEEELRRRDLAVFDGLVARASDVLRHALRDRPAKVFASSPKIAIPETNRCEHPGIAVVCGSPQFRENDSSVLLNPTLIIDVSANRDAWPTRTDRLASYRVIETVRQIAFLSPLERRVELHTRGSRWRVDHVARDGILRLESVGCDLALADLYP